MSQKTKNTTISTATIVGPIGMFLGTINVKRILKIVTVTEIIAAHTVTDLNVLNILIDVKAGNIMSADTSNEPTSFIAITMMIAIIIATIKLLMLVLTPVARAKFSSNVTANIL